MIALNFSRAIILFLVIFTVTHYLMLLYVDKRNKVAKENTVYLNMRRKGVFSIIEILGIFIATVGLVLTYSTSFRETPLYYVITTMTLALGLYVIIKGSTKSAFIIFILWYLTLIGNKLPDHGLFIVEGSEMTRCMYLYNHWPIVCAHNPNYNPFPTQAFIQAFLAKVINLEWYSWTVAFLYSLGFIIAYTLTMVMLTRIITRSNSLALLSIPLIAITPQTAINQHPYQWLSNMFTILAFAILVKSKLLSSKEVLAIVILYIASVFTHGTSISLIVILTFAYLMKFVIRTAEKQRLVTIIKDGGISSVILLILLLVTFVRSTYSTGYVEYVFPDIRSIIDGIINMIKSFLFLQDLSEYGAIHIPLYERAGLQPLQAYVWVYAPSLAIAYFLYALYRRRIRMIYLTIYMASGFVLGITLIGYGILKWKDFYWLNRTSYVFIPLLIPPAVEVLKRLLPNISIKPKSLAIIGVLTLILFTITTPIAVKDPNISPIQYIIARGGEPKELTMTDISEASNLLSIGFLNTEKLYLAVKSLPIKVPAGGRESMWRTEYSNALIESLKLLSFTYDVTLPKIIAIGSQELSDMNHQDCIYNSGRSMAFKIQT